MQILDYEGLQEFSTSICHGLSNPNLIINPDFSINQRNQTQYTITDYARKYTVDRWCVKGKSTIEVISNGIKYTKTSESEDGYTAITQVIENCSRIEGEELTLSIQYTDNNIKKIATLNIDKGWTFQDTRYEIKRIWILNYVIIALYARPDKMLEVDIHIAKPAPLNFSCIFNYAKLELGNISTLFVPPDLTIEKLKCMRYYQRISVDNMTDLTLVNLLWRPISYYIYATNDSRNFLDFYFNLDVKMRDIPTGKLYGITNDDTGYSIAYVKGGSPDKTRNWKYNIKTLANTVIIKVTTEDGNITDEDFNTKNLVFYSNSGIELDAEIYEYKSN